MIALLLLKKYNIEAKEFQMSPMTKKHGEATGTIYPDEDGEWRATVLFRDLTKGVQQTIGPEKFRTKDMARAFVVREGYRHGFEEDDIDIHIEG